MSPSPSVMQLFADLSPAARHLAQLSAIYYEGLSRTDLVKLSNRIGWTDAAGKPLVFNKVKSELNQLIDAQILTPTGRSADITVHPELKDFAVQEAIRDGQFDLCAKAMEADVNTRHSPSCTTRTSFAICALPFTAMTSPDSISFSG
jgi:hypothetical protein